MIPSSIEFLALPNGIENKLLEKHQAKSPNLTVFPECDSTSSTK